jgi:hypothetical protein
MGLKKRLKKYTKLTDLMKIKLQKKGEKHTMNEKIVQTAEGISLENLHLSLHILMMMYYLERTGIIRT